MLPVDPNLSLTREERLIYLLENRNWGIDWGSVVLFPKIYLLKEGPSSWSPEGRGK